VQTKSDTATVVLTQSDPSNETPIGQPSWVTRIRAIVSFLGVVELGYMRIIPGLWCQLIREWIITDQMIMLPLRAHRRIGQYGKATLCRKRH
jgi:hypothetical protein